MRTRSGQGMFKFNQSYNHNFISDDLYLKSKVIAISLFPIASRISQQQKVFVVEHYWQTRNAARVIDAWRDEFDNTLPHRETIYNIRDRIHQSGTVAALKRSGRPTSVNTAANAALVVTSLQQSPCNSANLLSTQLGISRSSVQNILRKNGYRLYHPCLVHG